MEAWPTGNRLRVKINGLPVGAYDQHVRLYLDPFLKPGYTNVLILAFDRPPAGGYGVTVTVKAPGNERWVEVLKFMPSKDKLEDSFEVPFVGAKK